MPDRQAPDKFKASVHGFTEIGWFRLYLGVFVFLLLIPNWLSICTQEMLITHHFAGKKKQNEKNILSIIQQPDDFKSKILSNVTIPPNKLWFMHTSVAVFISEEKCLKL